MGVYGVIGFPVSQSMSPIMHNQEFQALQMDAYYTAFAVHPSQLEQAIEGIRALHIKGINVTIPHKVAVIDYLDEIDEEARLIGAVNTIKNENGRLIGSNTDGEGYLRSLLFLSKAPLATKKVLVVGAGGAARAIVIAIARHGVQKIDIANRTISKAEQLVKHANQFVAGSAISIHDAEEHLSEYDIVINTTSVGMSPHVTDSPLQVHNLKRGTIVSDLIYNPLTTLFLKQAKERGALIDNGVGMFVHQGALAFEKWTGISPNLERMTKTVLNELGG
ncbi:shikimate dehydrogenase [Pueribacillus sp. YX66]|uniref:shikimate dehydrogenase n=1 Tax=Pueribacillus sp. YX66 TaxID=3229242 RepID=UPI00358D8569